MMIDHIGFTVKDIAKSKEMYKIALLPLGLSIKMEGYGYVGFGDENKNYFWIGEPNEDHKTIPTDIHVCFSAKDRSAVDAFYKEGIAAGLKDNGKPGIREMYDKNYYAAFLLDSDGNNIEAVCRT